VGHQWYWSYEFLTVSYDQYPDLFYGSTDFMLFLPSSKLIVFRFTSSDVIHRFGVPCLSLKVDCMPGKLSDSLVFYGSGNVQGSCYEFCGVKHSEIPVGMTFKNS